MSVGNFHIDLIGLAQVFMGLAALVGAYKANKKMNEKVNTKDFLGENQNGEEKKF